MVTGRSHDAGRQWHEPVAPIRKKHSWHADRQLSPHTHGMHLPRLLLYSGYLSFLEVHFPTLCDNLHILFYDGFNDGYLLLLECWHVSFDINFIAKIALLYEKWCDEA